MDQIDTTSTDSTETFRTPEPRDPDRSLHEWRDWLDEKQWATASWRTKLWWLRQAARRVPEIVRDALRAVRLYGGRIGEAHGVSRVRQLLRQCYVALVHDTSPTSYYTYRLYLPDRWNQSDRLLLDSWTSHGRMIYELNDRAKVAPKEKETLDDKRRFFVRCQQNDLPTPTVIASFENGTARFSRSSEPTLPPANLFVKPVAGKHGRGVTQFVYAGAQHWTNGETTYDRSALIDRLKQRSEQVPLVLQREVRNGSSWQPFTGGGLTTARIMTGRLPQGDIVPIGAGLRMPTGGSIVDNVNAGGIISQIDLQSGRLSQAVSMEPFDGTLTYESHPDTEHPLSGTLLPQWPEVVALSREAHEAVDVVTVGWDIALTEDGLTIIEGNCNWSAIPIMVPSICLQRYARVYDAWMSEQVSDH
mgnify:CR=1 FL=1